MPIGKPDNLVGQTFGFLVVLDAPTTKAGAATKWLCQCHCGVQKYVAGKALKTRETVSCGCYRKQVVSLPKSHGGASGKTARWYRVWHGIKDRCLNPNSNSWVRYGGRGITVCDRWLQAKNFYEDMGDPPENRTLERRNNDLGYNKKNCYWATHKEQANNRRSNRVLKLGGEQKTLAQWANLYGKCPKLVRSRLRIKWPLEKALEICR